jgi:hypothetical protein
MTDEIKTSVRKRIVIISNEIRVAKAGHNEFTRSGYFQPDDILRAINPLLAQYGLITVFDMTFSKEKEMYEGKLFIEDSSDESMKGVLYMFDIPMQILKGNAGSAQNAGATQTYCKRYMFMNAFNLADNKADPDNKGYKVSGVDYEAKLRNCKNVKELQACWTTLPAGEKGRLFTIKEEIKNSYAN